MMTRAARHTLNVKIPCHYEKSHGHLHEATETLNLDMATMEIGCPMSLPMKAYFIPYITPNHMFPLLDLACLFAAQGVHVTIITTPGNTQFLHHSVDKATALGHTIAIHTVPFPSKEVGLPDGVENCFNVPDMETGFKLFRAVMLLQHPIEQYMNENPPDCIVADMFYTWASDYAKQVGIPRLVFNVYSVFTLSLMERLRRPDSPHLQVTSNSEPFVVPDLPHPITMIKSQVNETGYAMLMDRQREAERKSFGVVVNSFLEVEPEYTEHYKKVMGHKVWHIGPTSLLHRTAEDEKPSKDPKSLLIEQDCLTWLNSKEPNSVVYVFFGVEVPLPDNQLYEIACGLESSGHDFLLVVNRGGHGKESKIGNEEGEEEEKEKWVPKGFEERVKNKGMIVEGGNGISQNLILEHSSVGGFLMTCGWDSLVDSIVAGVPMITWPVSFDGFFNEKLVIQVHRIGVELGAEEWTLDIEKSKVVGRDKVENAVRRLMDNGDETESMRRRARELGEKAKKAFEDGGSSLANLTALLQELENLRS